jgi:hypothetical protein
MAVVELAGERRDEEGEEQGARAGCKERRKGAHGGSYVREAQSCAASAPSLLLAFLCC